MGIVLITTDQGFVVIGASVEVVTVGVYSVLSRNWAQNFIVPRISRHVNLQLVL